MPVKNVEAVRELLKSPHFPAQLPGRASPGFVDVVRTEFAAADLAAEELKPLDRRRGAHDVDADSLRTAQFILEEISDRLRVVSAALDLTRSTGTPFSSPLKPTLALAAAEAKRASDAYAERAVETSQHKALRRAARANGK